MPDILSVVNNEIRNIETKISNTFLWTSYYSNQYAGCFCERDNCDSGTGDMTIINNHEDPYKLFVDDSLNTVLQPWDSTRLYLRWESTWVLSNDIIKNIK